MSPGPGTWAWLLVAGVVMGLAPVPVAIVVGGVMGLGSHRPSPARDMTDCPLGLGPGPVALVVGVVRPTTAGIRTLNPGL